MKNIIINITMLLHHTSHITQQPNNQTTTTNYGFGFYSFNKETDRDRPKNTNQPEQTFI